MQHYSWQILISRFIGTAMFSAMTWLFVFLIYRSTECRAEVAAFGIAENDSSAIELQEIEVEARNGLPAAGTVILAPSQLLVSARSMGEADAINMVRRMPGVATAGDYGSGLMVDGAEASQTLYRLSGVAIFFPYRFGGVFSTFNTPHFGGIVFERNIHDASMPSRLGAKFDFETPDNPTPGFHGVVNAGILSSSATLRWNPNGRFSTIISGRTSYIDELYGRLLRSRDSEAHYRFYDLNLTANYRIDHNNILSLNLFKNSDRLRYDDDNYAFDTKLRWSNKLASLRWKHRGSVTMDHRIYWTGFSNRLDFNMPQFRMSVPSSVSLAGVAGDLEIETGSDLWNIEAGYEAGIYRNIVQWARIEDYATGEISTLHPTTHPFELRMYAEGQLFPGSILRFDIGISASCFLNGPGYTAVSIAPRLTATAEIGSNSINVHIGRYRQFLHQVGFSEIGLSSDFWICADRDIPAQDAWTGAIDYNVRINESDYSITAGAYGSFVAHQPEYSGQIIDMLNADYSAHAHIITGKGYNTGFRMSAGKDRGRLTGTLSAGYGWARRRYPDEEEFRRGRTDPGLTLSAEICYRPTGSWIFGAFFRYADGRPYTPAKAMYIIAGNLITEYGKPNSRRLPAYHSLDLSATWLPGRKSSADKPVHILNFSIINAYGRHNVELRKFAVNIKDGSFYMKNVSSLYRFLPSISYTLQF